MVKKDPSLETTTEQKSKAQTRIPEGSVFYDRIIPALLIGMALIMGVLILIAAGVLLGIVPFI